MSSVSTRGDSNVKRIERYRDSLEKQKKGLEKGVEEAKAAIAKLTAICDTKANRLKEIDTKMTQIANGLEAAKVVDATIAMIDLEMHSQVAPSTDNSLPTTDRSPERPNTRAKSAETTNDAHIVSSQATLRKRRHTQTDVAEISESQSGVEYIVATKQGPSAASPARKRLRASTTARERTGSGKLLVKSSAPPSSQSMVEETQQPPPSLVPSPEF
ncbi:hypothetical protein CALVIDRAFT_598021 [Calocera viscosa TUFC12733]|uniref:Uncharacterized protein n=1 Tax=Calocera viscosa (strain TUFC12733) TaxID=1330018 RepID=A0A167MN88_CALVF|nr:hypothetical protein CALVIDRAFT_598021 [Calocera viscosa TUFC12733]